MCGGTLKEKMAEHEEFGVSLGKFKGMECVKCGEIFFDSDTADKIQQKSKEMGLFGLAKKTKVAQVGNSLAVRIPKEIAEFVNLKKEGEIKIVPKNRKELALTII
jgi:hypothetical protein